MKTCASAKDEYNANPMSQDRSISLEDSNMISSNYSGTDNVDSGASAEYCADFYKKLQKKLGKYERFLGRVLEWSENCTNEHFESLVRQFLPIWIDFINESKAVLRLVEEEVKEFNEGKIEGEDEENEDADEEERIMYF